SLSLSLFFSLSLSLSPPLSNSFSLSFFSPSLSFFSPSLSLPLSLSFFLSLSLSLSLTLSLFFQTLSKGCRPKVQQLKACQDVVDYASFLEELKSIDADSNKLPALINKYCVREPDQKKCTLLTEKIKNTPVC